MLDASDFRLLSPVDAEPCLAASQTQPQLLFARKGLACLTAVMAAGLDQEALGRMQACLAAFKGTHSFHNLTQRRR